MKEYCVDLELAKELKENGFPQIGKFYYIKWYEDNIEFRSEESLWDESCMDEKETVYDLFENYRCPTSDEILKELPKEVEYKFCYFLQILCMVIGYSVYYENNGGDSLIEITDTKLSNALAKMWLYLKKEGYIK